MLSEIKKELTQEEVDSILDREITVKESIKNQFDLEGETEIFKALLECYNEMSKEFKDKITFEKFYTLQRQMIQKTFDESIDYEEEGIIPVQTPEEDLCSICKKGSKSIYHKGYCIKCAEEMRQNSE